MICIFFSTKFYSTPGLLFFCLFLVPKMLREVFQSMEVKQAWRSIYQRLLCRVILVESDLLSFLFVIFNDWKFLKLLNVKSKKYSKYLSIFYENSGMMHG